MGEPAGAPIDEAAIAELLESTGGDRTFLAELIETYLDDAPRQIAALRRGVEAGSAEDVTRAAHALKGASASLGATGLFERSRALESEARAGRLDGAAEAVSGIEAEFERVATALRAVAAVPGD